MGKLWDKEKGWKNLLFSNWRDYIIFGLAIILILSTNQAYKQCGDIMAEPCSYCNCALKDQPVFEVNISGATNTSILLLDRKEDSGAGPAGAGK